MSDKTGISWTDATWNPVRGCSRVSEGCRNCYAERTAARFCGPGQPYEGLAIQRKGSKWTGEVRLVPEHLADPLRWRRPRRIFVNSMSDLFHERLSNEDIDLVLAVMLLAPHHTFQVLTKRAARMRAYFADPELYDRVLVAAEVIRRERPELYKIGIADPVRHPAKWIWLGVSVENQEAADERIPELLATPAAIRFLSCEPLLGQVDLTHRAANRALVGATARHVFRSAGGKDEAGIPAHLRPPTSIDWLIAGCESGPGSRPCDVAWLRSLRDQCAASGVAFFLKQAVGETALCDNPPTDRCGQVVRYQIIGERTAIASCGCTIEGGEACDPPPIAEGEGSKRKTGGVIELPYLDGVQHATFPALGETP